MISQKIDTFPVWAGMIETQVTTSFECRLCLAKFSLWRKSDKVFPEGKEGQVPGSLHSITPFLSLNPKQKGEGS